MSMKSWAIRSVHAANNHLSGAKATQVARKKSCILFVEFCAARHDPLLSIKLCSFRQVKAYIDYLANPPVTSGRKSLSPASLHNVLAQIRAAMTALGGKPNSLGITAKNLGLSPRNRNGKKLPVTDEIFFTAVAKAKARGEHGFAISIRLARYFSYRIQEALMSGKELKIYVLDCLDQIRIGKLNISAQEGCVLPELSVTDGTKGNRPRVVESIAKYARESLEVLSDAVAYLQTHDFLVEVKGKGLKEARSKAQRLVSRHEVVVG